MDKKGHFVKFEEQKVQNEEEKVHFVITPACLFASTLHHRKRTTRPIFIKTISILGNFNVLPSHSLTSNTNAENTDSKKLRVVTFNYLPSAYKFVTDWIHQNGHEHILAVASPGIKSRPTPAYKEVLPLIADDVNILVTSKTKSVLTPVLQQLKPDIILCFTFAHRISAEICQIPTYGVVNIHPSVLPLYRGPKCGNFMTVLIYLEQQPTAWAKITIQAKY